jgi:TolB-like protein/Tfp pilus assembly protein PilF
MDEELNRIISKALEKDVKDRYQHADDILADLRKLKKGKAQKPTKAKAPIWRIPVYLLGVAIIAFLLYSTLFKKEALPILGLKSIAVLPFTTIDKTEDSEIFSAGIHDDILSQIAKIHDLKVVSRTSVIRYKDTEKSIREIAQELGVETILEGSVRRYGEKIRIVAQLINAKTDDHLWTDTYDREYVDIFTIQSDVAQKIARALNATLTPQELHVIEEIPTDNLEAYEFYQQGNIIFRKDFTIENQESAMVLFEKAIELDPDFVMAYAMLCRTHLRAYWFQGEIHKDNLQKAKLALDKAQKLDLNHSSVHLAEGYYYYYGFRDYEKALESWFVALKDRPNDSDLLSAIGYVQRRQGKFDEALELLIKGSDIDPQSSNKAFTVAGTARFMRKWKLALQYMDRSILINPLNVTAHNTKIFLLVDATGDIEKARVALKEALNHIPPNKLIETRAYVEFLSRNYLNALKIRQEYRKNGNLADMQDFWEKGIYSLYAGKIELSISYFDSLRTLGEKAIQKNPKDWNNQFYLAMAYAHLGKVKDAINTANIATNLMPVSLDAISGSIQRLCLVDVYGTVGEFDKAIDEIDYLLSIPSIICVNQVKNYPLYDPLRDHPRFQEMLKKYGG